MALMAGKMVELLLLLELDLKLMMELALLVTVILGWVSSFPLAAFHADSPPFLLLPLVATLLPATLISNLGTDLSPASCTSGNTSCGTGLLLPPRS